MIPLPKDQLMTLNPDDTRFDQEPIFAGIRGAWQLCVAALCYEYGSVRYHRSVIKTLLELYTSETLKDASIAELVVIVRVRKPVPFLSRLLKFNDAWLGDWHDLRELPGCGVFVCDVVGLFGFGCRDVNGSEPIITKYLEQFDE